VDVRIEIPGQGMKRIRRKSPVQTRRGAAAFERQLFEDALSTSMKSHQERRYDEHAIEFLKTYVAANNKYASLLTKESILRVHLLPAFGRLLLTEIHPRAIEAYKAAKKVAGLSPKSINNHLSVLRKSLVVASDWGLLDAVPPIQWMKVPPQKFDFLDFNEAERLLDAAEPAWVPIILTALHTGLRIGELIGLRWEDVDLVARRLTVMQAVSRGRVDSPKNNRSRTVPLTNDLTAALKRHQHLKGKLVFCKRDGNMFTRDETWRPLRRACRRAGLREIGWHVLRHTFASHLAMRGAPLKAIQELLGHATIEMTMRYAHLSPNIGREAVELLDSGNKMGTSGPEKAASC